MLRAIIKWKKLYLSAVYESKSGVFDSETGVFRFRDWSVSIQTLRCFDTKTGVFSIEDWSVLTENTPVSFRRNDRETENPLYDSI